MARNPLKTLDPREFDFWKAQHLLNRAGFGGTAGQVRALEKMGLADAVDHVVNYEQVPMSPVRADDFDADIMRPRSRDEQQAERRARRNGDEATLERLRRERQQRQRSDRQQMASIQRWWMKRMIESPRPLEEKMTLFWHGHFATSYRAIEDSYHMFLQNQLFRSHAVGNFRSLTHGIIHDPAMLRYLNNNQNRKQRPNENLARELMELFTLGEGNAYTEDDIKAGARALTGYTYDDDAFVFSEQTHDAGRKRILGRSGPWDGDQFVDIIFTSRYVSEFICFKLYRYFVNDRPGTPEKESRRFVIALARVFRDGGYDVKDILKRLFVSEHFYDDANVASLIKSPVQLTVQALRALRTPARSVNGLLGACALMGQNLGYPPSVKGWDGGQAWINTATLYVRQNLMIYLLTGRRPDAYAWETDGAPYDATHLIEPLRSGATAPTPRDVAYYLLRFNLGAEPQPERVDTLTAFFASCGDRLENDVLIGALSLIAAMPEYQLC